MKALRLAVPSGGSPPSPSRRRGSVRSSERRGADGSAGPVSGGRGVRGDARCRVPSTGRDRRGRSNGEPAWARSDTPSRSARGGWRPRPSLNDERWGLEHEGGRDGRPRRTPGTRCRPSRRCERGLPGWLQTNSGYPGYLNAGSGGGETPPRGGVANAPGGPNRPPRCGGARPGSRGCASRVARSRLPEAAV